MEHRHVLPLVLLLSACDPNQGPAPESIDYPTYLARSIRAGCSTAYDCCDPSERGILLGASSWPDYDTCVAESEAAAAEHTDEALAMIASGAMLYDGAAAASCITVLESGTCSARAELIGRYFDHPCIEVVRGTAPLGAACGDGTTACESGFCRDGFCAALPTSGQACDGALCDGGACGVDGVCTSPGLEGDACMRDMQCELGLHCRGASWDDGVEVRGSCVPVDRCLGG